MKEIVLSEKEILAITEKMGKEITNVLKNDDGIPTLVVVMQGAMNFASDLVKHIKTDVFLDYIHISSYEGTCSTCSVKLIKDVTGSMEGKVVVLIEDIVDTGYSMEYLIDHMNALGAKKVLVATLFDKVLNRKTPIHMDFIGHTLDKNQFLVGYGLDYNGLHRNIPYVFVPTDEEIATWDIKLGKNKQ